MMTLARSASVALAGAVFVLAAPQLNAQTQFSGTSSGAFGDFTSSGLTSLGGLTFSAPAPWSFSLALGQTLSGINFGTVFLDRSVPSNYSGTFVIDLVFAGPTSGNHVFAGALSGNITSNEKGNVNIAFDGPFTIALAGGYTVAISLDPVTGQNFGPGSANNTDQAALVGTATFVSGPGGTGSTGVVPEPFTILLLGTGLAGVGAAARRRRNAIARE